MSNFQHYLAALAPSFDPFNEKNAIETRMDDDTYRQHAGLAPSDLKQGLDQTGGHLAKIGVSKFEQKLRFSGQEYPTWFTGRKETSAFNFGSLCHCMLLTPSELHQRYVTLNQDDKDYMIARARERKSSDAPKKFSRALTEYKEWARTHSDDELTEAVQETILKAAQERKIGDIKWHPQMTEYDEWKVAQELQGRTVVSREDWDTAEAMVHELHSLPVTEEVSEYVSQCRLDDPDFTELSLFRSVNMPQGPIHLKGRVDLMTDTDIADYKTTATVHPVKFGLDVEKYGYDFSMAGYSILAQELGLPQRRVMFIVQEKTPPFLPAIYTLPEEWLKLARIQYRDVVERLYDAYMNTGAWHGEFMAPEQALMPSHFKEGQIKEVTQFNQTTAA